ncbi:Holliday junction resolvase RuvX [Spongisporangium articulatum]|uniref:Putative pre-16S rRNA nuclease n=1 Tax=Spongisporangium articulatum TaxID=3362603 RepID=A0ABW8AR68_9ACTN
MRRGVRVAVDVGTVRVGVARSDPDGLLATPVETVAVPTGEELVDGPTRRADLLRIGTIVDETAALEVLVGLPRSLSGREGPSAGLARKYAVEIARLVAPVPVRLVDERFSSVSANQQLREAGVRGRRARPVVDQVAAVVFLQAALDGERATGRVPGALVVADGQEAGGP